MIWMPSYQNHVVHVANKDLPVTLEAAREHLRMDEMTVDDNLIKGLVMAATARLEKEYGIALLSQTIRQYHSGFPECIINFWDEPILLRVAPLLAVSSVAYIDTAGNAQTWDADEYTTGEGPSGPFITPTVGNDYPSDVAAMPNAVTVEYTAGFGSGPANVPSDIRLAILNLVGELYARRDNPLTTMPQIVDLLMHNYWRPKA